MAAAYIGNFLHSHRRVLRRTTDDEASALHAMYLRRDQLRVAYADLLEHSRAIQLLLRFILA
jgi:hypothetical protein